MFDSCAWESIAHGVCRPRAESATVLADVTSDAAKIEVVPVEDEAGVGGPAVGEVPEYRTSGAAGDENRVHGYRTLSLAEFQPGSGTSSRCKKTRTYWHRAHRLGFGRAPTSRASASLIPGHVAQPGSASVARQVGRR